MNKSLALDLPLHGRQWIEASAGTGKTFTLGLLVLRLLLERELPLPNILAVTFTNAATQELKIKIRQQIVLALHCLQRGLPADESINPESITANLLRQLLQHKSSEKLQELLQLAIQDCDRASIFTIHGFCARVLNEHALMAGQLLQQPSLITNTQALNTRLVYDLWREFSSQTDAPQNHSMQSLLRLWPTPESLIQQCNALLSAENLLPQLSSEAPAFFDMRPLTEQLRATITLHFEHAKQETQQASAAGFLNNSTHRWSTLEAAFEQLQNWFLLNRESDYEDPGFERLATIKTVKAHAGKEPKSALFAAIREWYEGFEHYQAYQESLDIACLHYVRQRLAQRREAVLQEWQQLSYEDLIAQVLQAVEGESGAEFCQQLRLDYPVALLDEFQDTDSLQWRIFSALYPVHLTENALYLIGDPKQAIYGFRGGDVYAYLHAKQADAQHWNLPNNFRSRPTLIKAVASVFEQAGDTAFRDADIRYYPVQAGGEVQDHDFLWHQTPATAMQWAVLPEYFDEQKQKITPMPAGKARDYATRACVEKIHETLLAGKNNQARLKARETFRSVQPRDIAVLVNTHKEAALIQSALSACGIASVISSQENLFSSSEALELHCILDALNHPLDPSRWRGALSTVLLNYNAEQILLLDTDDKAATLSAALAAKYRDLWLKQGVLSAMSQLCAAAAARLKLLPDGERRLSNYLQLAEVLQQASAAMHGPEHCLRWLEQAMQESAVDEEHTLRLDSDQERVKIFTLHKSKGLEFPLVFMPFAAFGKTHKPSSGLNLLTYHEQHRRNTHALLYGDGKKTLIETLKAKAAEEQMAEQVRLLYVGLTRARYYCWLCCGSVASGEKSGLASLLFRNAKDQIKIPTQSDILAKLKAIQNQQPGILIDVLANSNQTLPRLLLSSDNKDIRIAEPVVQAHNDWRVLSFSQLSQGAQHAHAQAAAEDEKASSTVALSLPDSATDKRFSGIAFGNALHEVLEHTSFAAWSATQDALSLPDSEATWFDKALLRQAYRDDELEPGKAQLTPLVFHTLRTTLPENLRLCDLSASDCLHEMEFHFSLRACEADAVIGLLKQHGILSQRNEFAFVQRLNGLMTGKIDLIYRHEHRFYICDYKSNWLPAYDAEHCQKAMRDSEYDFQALIYSIALHRWCKFRLQSQYDYEKHIGGVRYLFCRGLNADHHQGHGIVALRFERELIEALETLLHPDSESRA